MSLLSEAYEDFEYKGDIIQCAVVFNDLTEKKPLYIEDKHYTITTKKNIILRYNDIIKRVRDGKYFRIASDGDDVFTPNSALLDMRQVKADCLNANLYKTVTLLDEIQNNNKTALISYVLNNVVVDKERGSKLDVDGLTSTSLCKLLITTNSFTEEYKEPKQYNRLSTNDKLNSITFREGQLVVFNEVPLKPNDTLRSVENYYDNAFRVSSVKTDDKEFFEITCK